MTLIKDLYCYWNVVGIFMCVILLKQLQCCRSYTVHLDKVASSAASVLSHNLVPTTQILVQTIKRHLYVQTKKKLVLIILGFPHDSIQYISLILSLFSKEMLQPWIIQHRPCHCCQIYETILNRKNTINKYDLDKYRFTYTDVWSLTWFEMI